MTFAKTLREAREDVEAHLVAGDTGTTCPCCGQFCKLYKRKLNSNMARFLIDLVQQYERKNRWVHFERCTYKGRDYSYLLQWGLAVTRQDKTTQKRMSGFWKPTQEGIDFVHNRISIASHVYLYNNGVRGFTKKRVTIVDALGKHFNYQELMHS
jgi:hypothetical protein